MFTVVIIAVNVVDEAMRKYGMEGCYITALYEPPAKTEAVPGLLRHQV